MSKINKKVIVAMSGGVDSSVSAFLLKKQGYEVIGFFMRLSDNSSESETAARNVCKRLGIKFYTINLHNQFKKEVIDYFISSYKKGLTPNPCVKCNKAIKFGELFKLAEKVGADFISTGHYLIIKKEKDEFNIYKGLDRKKDQSYYMYNLNQNILKKLIFPVGELFKNEVYKIAKKENLPVLKSESQDICFLVKEGKIFDHNEYLKDKIKLNRGPIKSCDGEVLGKHKGLPLYTIGQRRGVDVGGRGPYYVSEMDYKNNTLYVVNDINDKRLFNKIFNISNVNWISDLEPHFPFYCSAVIRYGHKPSDCQIIKKNDILKVTLSKPERAITPGQSAVFYLGDKLIGGGIII